MKNDQTELRVMINKNALNRLQNRLGIRKSVDLTRAAFALLDWASEETEHGRNIFSANSDGKDVHRLAMPELTHIRAKDNASRN